MAKEGFKRKLTSILSADVVGYSRLMGDDEEATVRTLTSYREVLSTLIEQHNGKVLDSPGDNLLAEFVSVVDAVQCAVAVQKEIDARNTELPENRRMQFRIGINLGDVIQEEGRIYGDGVNIAARLEGLAEPGGICISKTAFDYIESKLPYGYEFLGEQTVKNISKPVRAYRVTLEPRVTMAAEPIDLKSVDTESSITDQLKKRLELISLLVSLASLTAVIVFIQASGDVDVFLQAYIFSVPAIVIIIWAVLKFTDSEIQVRAIKLVFLLFGFLATIAVIWRGTEKIETCAHGNIQYYIPLIAIMILICVLNIFLYTRDHSKRANRLPIYTYFILFCMYLGICRLVWQILDKDCLTKTIS